MDKEIHKIWNQASKYPNDRVKLAVWLECMGLMSKEEMYIDFLEALLQANSLGWEEKYFLYWQTLGKIFTKSGVRTRKVVQKQFQTYYSITKTFQKQFSDLKPVSNRNKQVVLVTTQQFLGLMHAPTKTTLDRAYMLRKLGKQVVIVNTAEQYGGYFEGVRHVIRPSYIEELSNQEWIEYCGVEFPYVQFEPGMPNIENAKVFYDYIRELKPFYVVNIGGNSLLLDGCAQMVPVLNINTVPSAIACTQATKQVLGRKLLEEDEQLLLCLGKTVNDVIEGRFTWSLKPQRFHYTREMLGLPQEVFLLAVVGTRLSEELDDDFFDMLEASFDKGAFLVIIGEMCNYESLCENHEKLSKHSVYLGRQTDVLAVLECCDLYVNPRRTGGGSSVVEAMYKGLPAISLNEGDVSVGAGKLFCVNSYSEMSRKIIEYMDNSIYYAEMSLKAKERANYALDTESAFSEIIFEFEDACV